MFRLLLLVIFYGLMIPLVGVVGILWTLVSGSVDWLFFTAMKVAYFGVKLVGVQVEVLGKERLDPNGTYIFMCNHVSNLDPPIVVPMVPRRSSVLVKKELFRVPILATAMRMASFVAVDRQNRDAAIASVQAAKDVMQQGINIIIFPEGTRSPDGKLLPFKKGPFHLAVEAGAKVVPMTIHGTERLWPKGKMEIRSGVATLVFHEPVDASKFASREELGEHVRQVISSALPESMR
jgi:1-acyl-sn-glycerol-3-phosphate acyltransferase